MQIEKINENQIEVILDIEDLKRKNISLHSFMCKSSESQNLFFDILNYADEEIGFNLKNYEVLIEAFSVPKKNAFILLITRVPKITYLYPSKNFLGKFKFNKPLWIKFDNLQDFCRFCNLLENNSNIKSSLYYLKRCYFLHIKANSIRNYFYLLNEFHEFSNTIYRQNFILDENAQSIIKNCAIQTAKKYFA